MKAKLILILIKAVLWSVLLGVGVWYLHSSISDTSVPYVSLPRFLNSIGACENGACDIASANGCFLCPYVQKLFLIIEEAMEVLWDAIISHTWILLVIGLVIFMFWKAYEIISKANEENAKLEDIGKKELNFLEWFEAVKGQLIRVMIVGAILGAAGFGGVDVMRAVVNAVVYPVMYIGTILSMAMAGIGGVATCGADIALDSHAMAGVGNSFVCVIGTLNAVVLLGANSGFAMMNFAALGLGGTFLTWVAGFALVLVFMSIGFRVLFDILNVVFNFVFIIIFMPLFVASYAFNETWDIAKGVGTSILGMLVKTAARVVGITLNVMIISKLISFSQEYTMSSDPEAEYAIVEKCERIAYAAGQNGEIDKNTYASCFNAEKNANPTAFQYLDRGWDFLMMLLFVFLVYYVLLKPKLKDAIGLGQESYFKFGDNLKTFGKSLWDLPFKIIDKIPIGKK